MTRVGFAPNLYAACERGNPALPPTDVVGPHGASSKEKAIWAFSREGGGGSPSEPRARHEKIQQI